MMLPNIHHLPRLMLGLMESLPRAQSYFPSEERRAWLRAMEECMRLLYEDDNEIAICEPPFPLTATPHILDTQWRTWEAVP